MLTTIRKKLWATSEQSDLPKIIAWRIFPSEFETPKPITISGDEENSPYAVMCPNGTIIDQGRVHEGFAAWEAVVRERWAKEHAEWEVEKGRITE
jgi:hypothetical protein